MDNNRFEKFANQRSRKLPIIILILAVILPIAQACTKGAETLAESPTAVVKMQVEAVKNKDVAAFKKTLSKGALKQLEDIGKPQNLPPDKLLLGLFNSPDYLKTMPEVRKENIQGDGATLDIKQVSTIGGRTSTGWLTHKFVKEDGGWKDNESPIEGIFGEN
jgi:hypothetical protein